MDQKMDSRFNQKLNQENKHELTSLRHRIETQKKAAPTQEIVPKILETPLKKPTKGPTDLPKDDPIRIGFYNQQKTFIEEGTSTQFHRGSFSRRSYARMFWSATAALIDGLVLLSLSCFLILSFKAITHVSLLDFKSLIAQQKGVFFAFSVAWIYFFMVIQRAFLGFSIGEWACGLRLGFITQRLKGNYVLLVIGRMTLVVLTGFVLLPILSALTGYDIAGLLSRLPLVEEFTTRTGKK